MLYFALKIVLWRKWVYESNFDQMGYRANIIAQTSTQKFNLCETTDSNFKNISITQVKL